MNLVINGAGQQILAFTIYFYYIFISNADLWQYFFNPAVFKQHIRRFNLPFVDNLYIFDAPSIVWEDEFLGKVNDGLTFTFDISIRFKEVEYMLKRVENNLSVFVELANAEESKRLEWIVIILIFIEILHLFLNRLFE